MASHYSQSSLERMVKQRRRNHAFNKKEKLARRQEAEGVVYQLEKLTDQTNILYQATQKDLDEA